MTSFNLTGVESVAHNLAAGETGYLSSTAGLLNANVSMGAGAMLLNSGFVNHFGTAVQVIGPNGYIENHGDLVGGGVYATVFNHDFGGLIGGSLHLVNSGRIGTRGVSETDAIYISGNNSDITNSGIIESRYGVAIMVVNDPLGASSKGVSILNSGQILGEAGGAIELLGTRANIIRNTGQIVGMITTGDGWDRIFNHGTIQGSVSTGAGTGHLANSGLIDGSVEMLGGSAYIVNSGTITGNLALGSANDSVDLRGGTLGGYVSDFGGSDTYRIDDSGVQLVDSGGISILSMPGPIMN